MWTSSRTRRQPFRTLPDHLRPGLDLVFVGINPGLYSVQRGHYFARPASRFWPAFSRSALSAPVRRSLGLAVLGPAQDGALLKYGIGFTDLVKRPSRGVADLRLADYQQWVPRLRRRLTRYQPRVVCFHGLTAYRAFARYGLGRPSQPWALGPQPVSVGQARLFVAPNPSPANAHFRPADYVAWYDRLDEFLRHAKDESR